MDSITDLLERIDWSAVVWTDVLARLHPLVLHMPIALFVVLALLELPRLFGRAVKRDGVRTLLIVLLVISTPLTAASGWYLNVPGEYGDAVTWHQRLGIALAAMSLVVGLTYWWGKWHYPVAVWLGCLLLLPTAHLGASLTHGEDFLLEPWQAAIESPEPGPAAPTAPAAESVPLEAQGLLPDAEPGAGLELTPLVEAPPAEPAASALAFEAVQPIFEERCGKCHGSSKRKGKLALHTLEALAAGGESGPVVVPGDPAASALLERVHLPEDDDDHMPPSNKPQPTDEELARIEAWIAGLAAGDLPPPAPIEAAVEEAIPTEEPQGADEPPPSGKSSGDTTGAAAQPQLEGEAVAALQARLVHVEPAAQGSSLVRVDFAAAELEPGDAALLLEPLAPSVVEVGLAGAVLGPADLALLGDLPRLADLDLRQLPGDPLDLAPLTGSASLRRLNLAGTPLAEGAAEQLAAMAALERVYLWGTGLDEATLAALAAARPELELIAASPPPDAALEVEPEVVFTRIPDGTDPDTPSAENTACPITGSPVDPRYTVQYEGRVIGFCCPNCPKTFWDDPEVVLAVLDGLL